jgi:hypothetical protein
MNPKMGSRYNLATFFEKEREKGTGIFYTFPATSCGLAKRGHPGNK